MRKKIVLVIVGSLCMVVILSLAFRFIWLRPSEKPSVEEERVIITDLLTTSNVNASQITATEAVITWVTSGSATSQVEYGLDANYGSMSLEDTGLVSYHEVVLRDLIPATSYHCRVISKNRVGEVATSRDYTFETLD